MANDRIIARFASNAEFHQNRYWQSLDESVEDGVVWLDLGAGSTLHNAWVPPDTQAVASRAKRIVGCDLVTEHLRENPWLDDRVVCNGEALPFREGVFGLVTANMVLEHLSEPSTVFAEVRRVLAAAGKFLFVTPNRRHPIIGVLAVVLNRRARRRLAVDYEGREAEHVFPTFYEANTVGKLTRELGRLGLAGEIGAFASYPLIPRPKWLVMLECLGIRWLGFKSNILGSVTVR